MSSPINLKESLSQDETVCSACGRTSTKDKMKIYKIKAKETNLGTHTENILGGLGGSRHVTKKRIEFYEGYICKKCEKNWEIACLIWIGVMLLGEFFTYIIYRLIFEPNTDTAVKCFALGTLISFICARYCWIAYRKNKRCHIKVID